MSKVISAADAARLIGDGMTVSVSSSSGLGCPDAVLGAIGARFDAEGSPKNITTLHPIAAGDMYGIKGIDHLAKPGLLKRTLCGSYPSGPSASEPPQIWKMIGDNSVAAYNVPSGILFDMHREAAAKRPGVLTKVGLDTFVDPRHQGCAMNEAASDPIVSVREFDGEEWLYFRAIVPDVAIIRATTADERGNLTYEHEGAYLGGLEQALAARNNGGIVIAQVKRVVENGSLKPHDVRVPGVLVDHIVVAPDQLQTTLTPYDPAISGEIFRPLSSFSNAEMNVQKAIARRVAMELSDGMAVNIGFGISANVPRILLEEGQHGKVTWVIEQGAVGGVPLLDFKFGCSSNADAFMPSPHQFIYFQAGGFDASLLSFLQIDRHGSVNVSKLSARPHVTAGAGGFVDITARARKIVFSGFFNAGAKLSLANGGIRIDQEGKIRKIVSEVEHISFSGKRAVAQGQDITYVTERCVMQLTPDGLMVTELAPGIDLERDVLAQAEIPLAVANDLKTTPAALYMDRPIGLSLNGGASLGVDVAEPIVTFDAEGAIGTITLRRPKKFNALDIPMLQALDKALDAAEAAEGVRVVLICAEGKGFSAGGDIEAWSAMSPADFQVKWVRYGHRIFDRLARLRQATIAVLSGHALGGGLELAVAADFRVAETHIKLGFPETSIGVVPGWSGTQRAVRRFGAQLVRRMAIGGEVFSGSDALALGIVDRVVEMGSGLAEAKAWAEKIAARGPLATETTKLMIAVAEGEESASAAEALAGAFIATTDDLKVGAEAFRSKQKPGFSRR